MAHDVFISYSVKDKTTADAVCATLEHNGIRCWIAPRDVLPSMEYAEALIDAIVSSRLLVLVFSSHANESIQVRQEVERAVSHGLPVLPFRIEDVSPSHAMELFISGRHWLDALTPPLEAHLQELAKTTKLLLSRMPGARDGKHPDIGPADSAPFASPAPAERSGSERVSPAASASLPRSAEPLGPLPATAVTVDAPGGAWPRPQPEFQPPPAGMAIAPRKDRYAIVALVIGLVTWLIPLAGLAAIACAMVARRHFRQSRSGLAGRGLATAGLVLGVIQCVAWLFVAVVFVIKQSIEPPPPPADTSALVPGSGAVAREVRPEVALPSTPRVEAIPHPPGAEQHIATGHEVKRAPSGETPTTTPPRDQESSRRPSGSAAPTPAQAPPVRVHLDEIRGLFPRPPLAPSSGSGSAATQPPAPAAPSAGSGTHRLLHARMQLTLLGPQVTADGVVFRFKPAAGSEPKTIYLSGSFNHWNPDNQRYLMREDQGDGVWSITIKLPPGTYLYKYVVDGRWVLDPRAPSSEDDGSGGRNGKLVVK